MMAAADNDRFRNGWERAVLYRDGLLIALLSLRSLRIANAAQIRIDRHLHRRGVVWWLRFEKAEMKAARPFECPWPDTLAAALDRYLEVHRTRITDGGRKPRRPCDALWLSRNGTPMKTSPLADRVTIRTNDEWGTPINPHTFRHIVTTEIATHDPANVTDISAVLGHAGPSVGEKHYNRARRRRSLRGSKNKYAVIWRAIRAPSAAPRGSPDGRAPVVLSGAARPRPRRLRVQPSAPRREGRGAALQASPWP